MTKKGPLSKTEIFYIQHHLDQDAESLAKELDRAKGLVESCLEEAKAKQAADEPVNAMAQFGNNQKGSVVMTKSASEFSDSFRTRKAGPRPDCVTAIRKKP